MKPGYGTAITDPRRPQARFDSNRALAIRDGRRCGMRCVGVQLDDGRSRDNVRVRSSKGRRSHYWHVKVSASLIGGYVSNGHGDPTEAQLCFVGVYGAPVGEPGWRPADSVAAWLEDLREPEARGVTYVVSRDGLSMELSV
jgi:hypothetical protein